MGTARGTWAPVGIAAAIGMYVMTTASPTYADYAGSIANLDPVSYWRFNETWGRTAFDETGTNHGSYMSHVGLGEPGSDWSGSDTAIRTWPGYVKIDHSDAYLLDSGTVTFSFQDLNSVNFAGLFSKDSTGYDTGGHLTAVTTKDGRVRVRLQSTSSSYEVESDPFIALNEWYQFAFTFGTEGMKLYINGTEVDSNGYTGGLGLTSGGIGNYEPLVIGANTWDSKNLKHTPITDKFSGRIDDFAIFDKALSDAEIRSLYTNTPVPEPAVAAMSLLGFVLLGRRLRRRA